MASEYITRPLRTYIELMRRWLQGQQGEVTGYLGYPLPEIAENLIQDQDSQLSLPALGGWGGYVQVITPSTQVFSLARPGDNVPLYVYGEDGPYDHIVVGPGEFWGVLANSFVLGPGLPIIVHLSEGEYDYIPGLFESLYCFDATYALHAPGRLADIIHWLADPPLVIELIVTICWEPADWLYTARDLARGEWTALIGILPIIPGSLGDDISGWINDWQKRIDWDRLNREEVEVLIDQIEEAIPRIKAEVVDKAGDEAAEVTERALREEVERGRAILDKTVIDEVADEVMDELTSANIDLIFRRSHWLDAKRKWGEAITGQSLDQGGDLFVEQIIRDVIDNPSRIEILPDHSTFYSGEISRADGGGSVWLYINVSAPKHGGVVQSIRFSPTPNGFDKIWEP